MNARVLVGGIGRPHAGDDAAGLLIAQELRDELGPLADVVLDSSGGWKLIEGLAGHELLVIVDCAQAGEGFPAGELRRLAYPADAEVIMGGGSGDTHALSVDSILRLSQALGKLPSETWIYAVAGEHFEPETGLSTPVSRGIGPASRRIASDIRRWHEARPSEV